MKMVKKPQRVRTTESGGALLRPEQIRERTWHYLIVTSGEIDLPGSGGAQGFESIALAGCNERKDRAGILPRQTGEDDRLRAGDAHFDGPGFLKFSQPFSGRNRQIISIQRRSTRRPGRRIRLRFQPHLARAQVGQFHTEASRVH